MIQLEKFHRLHEDGRLSRRTRNLLGQGTGEWWLDEGQTGKMLYA